MQSQASSRASTPSRRGKRGGARSSITDQEHDRLVMACELFERGYPEDCVQAALTRFPSLPLALQWLSGSNAACTSSSASSSIPAPLSPATRTPASVSQPSSSTPARRLRRKRPLSDPPVRAGGRGEEGASVALLAKSGSLLKQDGSKEAGQHPRDGITSDSGIEGPTEPRNDGGAASTGTDVPIHASPPPPPPPSPFRQPAPPQAAAASPAQPACLRLSDKTEECTLCFVEVPAKLALHLRCRHGWYCIECMVKHAEARLCDGKLDVTCPQCRVGIPEQDLKELLPPETRERLQSRSLSQAVSKTGDLFQCPTPDCPMVVALEEGSSVLRFRCPLCRRCSCLKCGAQPWHRGLTCKAYAETRSSKAEEGLRSWMRETGTPQCPQCGMAVTKQNLDRQHTQYQECHKMMCRNCSTRFCFKCLKVLTDKFSCGCSADAHQFIDPVTQKPVKHLRKPKGRATGQRMQPSLSPSGGRGRGRKASRC